MNKPAAIISGNGTEHNMNSFQANRAIATLRAITGNLDVPGGEVQLSSVRIPRWTAAELTLANELPADRWTKFKE